MPTDHDNPEPPNTVPSSAVDAPQPTPVPDATTATARTSQPHDEMSMREWEGLPPDTIILAPAFTTPPMH